VRGCTFFGTGGGGNPKEGISLLMETLRSGKSIGWTHMKEVNDEALVTSLAGMGSIAPLTAEKEKMFEQLGLRDRKAKRPLVEAVRVLEEHLQKSVDVIVPAELGGGNTAIPLDTAAQLGKIIVDGGYAGRAIPEIEQCAPAMAHKEVTPIACVDDWGKICYDDCERNERVDCR